MDGGMDGRKILKRMKERCACIYNESVNELKR